MEKPSEIVIRYSITQMLYQIGTVMLMSVGALSGRLIAPGPEFSTLPLALAVAGTLAGLFPASLFMKKNGRKAGFLLGTAIGMTGAATMSAGLAGRNFGVFSLGFFLFGLHQSFMQFLRFAAMEAVAVPERPNTLSWILLAGIPAAFLGPLAGLLGSSLIPGTGYLGSYLLLFAALSAQLVMLMPVKDSVFPSDRAEMEPRPFRLILKQYDLWVAVSASAVSYALMVMLMAAVPVAMNTHGHLPSDSTLVLQWHVLGMYLPSFFSGYLIRLLGKKPLILLGILVMALEAGIAMLGYEFQNFAVSLVLLGIGWNFMYVGGTNLLVEQYDPSEKNKVQAANDTIVSVLTTLSTYGAGFLESRIGWNRMNLVVIQVLIAAFVLTFLSLRRRGKKDPAAAQTS